LAVAVGFFALLMATYLAVVWPAPWGRGAGVTRSARPTVHAAVPGVGRMPGAKHDVSK